jgi:hypothetical protein
VPTSLHSPPYANPILPLGTTLYRSRYRSADCRRNAISISVLGSHSQHTVVYRYKASATMTIEGTPLQPSDNGGAPQVGVSAQPSEADLAFATSRPIFATEIPTIGASSASANPPLSNKTLISQAKVAIPRQRAGIAPRYNRRVPRACESCRQRKTKCSGDTPVCRQCRELRATCKYPQGWREKTKK